ncbi:hypothetical protein HRS9122_08030 [Pyrenophora teres f. teres]|nr:hypothetical protein HRS9122_08030 [Pyrenophora teres f. teres]
MGKSSAAETPGAHSTVEKKRRRLHPIRRIAKFLLGGSKQKKKRDTTTDGNQEPEGKTCHGASRWQNVLPFLEPLIALDPKLSFIEDRILKRPTQSANEKARQQQRQQPKPEPPRTLRDLQQRVQDENVFCNCDECAPKYYKISTTNSHGTIRDVPSTSQRALSSTTTTQKQSFLTPSQLRNSAAAAIGPQLELRFHGTYEAMSLVRHHIAWLDATYIHPSATPTPAVKQLGALLTTWHPHLSSANLRHTLSTRQLATLFSHLNTVFFNGCIPPTTPPSPPASATSATRPRIASGKAASTRCSAPRYCCTRVCGVANTPPHMATAPLTQKNHHHHHHHPAIQKTPLLAQSLPASPPSSTKCPTPTSKHTPAPRVPRTPRPSGPSATAARGSVWPPSSNTSPP